MRRAQDLCRIAENRGVARYSGFLSDREQSLAKAAMNQAGSPGPPLRAAILQPSANCCASNRRAPRANRRFVAF